MRINVEHDSKILDHLGRLLKTSNLHLNLNSGEFYSMEREKGKQARIVMVLHSTQQRLSPMQITLNHVNDYTCNPLLFVICYTYLQKNIFII